MSLPVFLVAGSALQTILSLSLPARWATVPLLAYLLVRFLALVLDTLLPQTSSPTRGSSSVPLNVVPGRAAAQLPLPSGAFRSTPAEDTVVVFHIGAQFNHPLGPLCPGAKETGDRFNDLIADLKRRRDEVGLLSSHGWSTTEDGSLTTMMVMYFRDVQSLHRFAHEEMHRSAWDWFAAQKFPHIGVYHETFEVPRKSYECVYLNCKPILMGGATSKVVSEKGGEEQWVNALVSADVPALKTQYKRMGRDTNGVIIE